MIRSAGGFTATIDTPGAYRVEVALDGGAVASQAYTVPGPCR